MAISGVMVARLPREARHLVRRTVLSRRVATALAVAVGGVAIAFAAVAFVPAAELPQTLPIAIIITIAARITATARLRSGGGWQEPAGRPRGPEPVAGPPDQPDPAVAAHPPPLARRSPLVPAVSPTGQPLARKGDGPGGLRPATVTGPRATGVPNGDGPGGHEARRGWSRGPRAADGDLPGPRGPDRYGRSGRSASRPRVGTGAGRRAMMVR